MPLPVPLTGVPVNATDFFETIDLHTAQIAADAAHFVAIDGILADQSDDTKARLGGKDGALNGFDGAVNPTIDQVYYDAGSITGVTTAGGELALLFSTAFPTGLTTITLTNGDDDAAQFVPAVKDASVSGCTAVCRLFDGTPLGSTLVRVNFHAEGW